MRKYESFDTRRSRLTVLLGFLAFLFLMINTAGSVSVSAAAKKPVRVGYYENENFQAGAADDLVKTGYSYEYMRRLQMYTDWEYEYVYGEYGELYEKLLSGEIDILTGLAFKEERADLIGYPDIAMGDTPYTLLKRSEETDITSKPATIAGRKIGVLEGAMKGIMETYLSDNKIEAELVIYDDLVERDQALKDGDVDITIVEGNGTGAAEGVESFAQAGSADYYVCVSKDRADLLEELNQAQTDLFAASPQIKSELNSRWFRNNAYNTTLTSSERAWKDTHSTFTVGYFSDYLPYSGRNEKGFVTGVVKDLVPEIFEALSIDTIHINYVAYDSYADMSAALVDGKIDACFPVYANYWATEQYDTMPTNSVITSFYTVIYKGEYPDMNEASIAIRSNNAMNQAYKAVQFPNNNMVLVDSVEDCLDAVVDGSADVTLVNGLRTDYYLRLKDRYRDLHAAQVAGDAPIGFAVNRADAGTLEILNHGINLMPQDYALTHTYEYEEKHKITAQEFIRENVYLFSLLIVGAAAIILFMVLRELMKNKKYLEMEAKQKKALEDAKEAAESANKAKTTFLFNMSHDIRTPMNAIMGFRDLLEKNQEDPEKRGYYLKQIDEASSVLLSIINNVLEMARIEKGTLVKEEIAWSAEQFNDTLYSVFHQLMVEKGIEFTRTINVEHHYVFCDPTKLREVFFNILANAMKYTNAGGSVTMLLEEIPSEEDGYALYRTTIQDTGIGMSEEFLPHLFEEFARERNSTTSKIEGTGLGMPIVKRLVDFMDGSIEVTSTQGVGTTIAVTLPHRIAEKKDLTEVSGIDADETLFKGKRILLAEDIAVNAEIAKAILTEAGFIIDVAEDGAICVDMLKNAQPGYYSLVLMDIQMPNMNGYEAASAIRGLEDLDKAQIPILAMTANAFEEDKREALHAGMNGHVAKPINVRLLMKELARVLSQS